MIGINLTWHRAGKPIAPRALKINGAVSPNLCLSSASNSILRTAPEMVATLQNSGAGSGYRVFYASESSVRGFVAIYGAIDNRFELLRQLEFDPTRKKPVSSAELLWGLYEELRTDAFIRLKGNFTAIVTDYSSASIHLFRSPLLGRSLFYFVSRTWFIAGSRPSDVLQNSVVDGDLNEVWLAHFFSFRTPQNAMTPFSSVNEVKPGELLSVNRREFKITKRSAEFGMRRVRFPDEREYGERFDELVSQAVDRKVKGRKNIGIMLSGGLDSVPAAYWMRQHQEPDSRLAAYSWSLRKFPEADESAAIVQIADTIGIPLHLVVGDELWPLKDVGEMPLCRDTPLHNPFRPLKQAVYKMAAADGCRFIFNGNYGDNLYPESHHVLLDSMRGGKLRRFAGELIMLLSIEGLRGFYHSSAVRQVAKTALGWQSRLSLCGASLTPFANDLVDMKELWPPGASTHPRPDHYQALLGVDIARGINDECYFAEIHGLELVEPYVDWDLVDYVLSIPSYLFWRYGEAKVLMREAMRGRIPESVRTSPRRGLLDSFFFYGINNRIGWFKQRLLSGDTDWPRFVERKHVRSVLEKGEPNEMESMLILRCLLYEMWLDRYIR